MLLHSPSAKPLSNFHRLDQIQVSLSSRIAYSFSFSSGFLLNSSFLKQSVKSPSKSEKNPSFILCSSVSQVGRYGRVLYESRTMVKWKDTVRKISMMEDQNVGAASVLNQAENGGKFFSKWEISRMVKELRKFKRYKSALEVFEWMNNRVEKYRMTTSDAAIQLDLVAKVHGVSSAEQYFLKLPDALKDKRIYGALLNVYAQARMREKAESLMSKMRDRGYSNHPLPFNVMMTLYMNVKDHESIESLVLEMKEKNIELDLYSYNIWLSSCGAQGSAEKMEDVFNKMQRDTAITPNWTTFSTMATMYIKLGRLEKAESCLRNVEGRIMGRDRLPYHYLISLYCSAGKKDEVYRVWKTYKDTFVNIPNLGYHTIISALVRMDDIDSAENIYDEWLSVKSVYDPRIANLLLGSYVRKGLSQKAETFFDQMIEMGGKPNAMTLEILAEDHIRNGKIPEALSCLKNATLALGSKNWKPKPVNVASILEVFEQKDDVASKDALLEIMRQTGCLDDESYMSCIPASGGGTFSGSLTASGDRTEGDGDENGDYELLGQLQESL